MGLVESLPVQRVRPVLFLPLWLGTLRDASGNANHIDTVTAPVHWATSGGRDGPVSPGSGRISTPGDPSLEISGDITIFASLDVQKTSTVAEYIIRTVDASGPFFYYDTRLRFWDGAVASSFIVDALGSNSLAVTSQGISARPRFFIDGSFVGIGSSNTLLDSQSGVWRFLGTGSGTGVKSPVHCICVYDGVLTDTEIQSLHDWSQSRFTPRKQWPGGGLSIPSASGQTWEPKFLDSIQASRITLANVTGGQLSNSGANVETGTWALSEDDTGKYYDCVGNGQLTHPLIGADGFTTDAFVEEGTATLTKTTTHLEIDATAGDKIRALRITV